MSDRHRNRQGANPRVQLALIALVFILPLAAAVWLYYQGEAFRPEARTNHGTLLEPIVNLRDELGASVLADAAADRWAVVYVLNGPCDAACRDALYKQRQTRLMLGQDMDRVVRILLHGTEPPDNLLEEHERSGLQALEDPAARQLLNDLRPRDVETGGFYLLDPLGNVVMYFPADIRPADLVEDLDHLLELSRIG